MESDALLQLDAAKSIDRDPTDSGTSNQIVMPSFYMALERDPNFILMIGSKPTEHYKGIGTIIYASTRVGLPVENIRWTLDGNDVVTFEELKARSAAQPMR